MIHSRETGNDSRSLAILNPIPGSSGLDLSEHGVLIGACVLRIVVFDFWWYVFLSVVSFRFLIQRGRDTAVRILSGSQSVIVTSWKNRRAIRRGWLAD